MLTSFRVGMLALDTVGYFPAYLKYSLPLASVREFLSFPLPIIVIAVCLPLLGLFFLPTLTLVVS